MNGGPFAPMGAPLRRPSWRTVDGMTMARLGVLVAIERSAANRHLPIRLFGSDLRSARWLHEHGYVNADEERREFWAKQNRPPTHEEVDE